MLAAMSSSLTSPGFAGAPAAARFGSAAGAELLVGGVAHRGWRAVKVTASLDAPAVKCTLDLAERWTDDPALPPRAVRPGAACRLTLDGDVVVDGWIDAVDVSYDTAEHVLTVVARDKVGDLVDCAAVLDGPHEWAGLRLDEIARRLAAPFGVSIVADIDPGPAFPRFAVQPGETAWEALDRAARARGILLAGDGTGRLRLTRAAEAAAGAGPIEYGVNVRRANATFDHAGRHSVVCVRGQAEGGGAGAEARLRDDRITRHRPRVLVAEAAGGASTFADRAAWEVRAAAGRSVRVAYVVAGWRGATGALWRTMTRVPVRDPLLGIDANLLVSAVVYSLTPQDGSVTEVEVTLPDAYDTQPAPPAAGRAASGAERGLFDVTSGTPVRVPVPGGTP
jgi:prophage tail gpP-like protein